ASGNAGGDPAHPTSPASAQPTSGRTSRRSAHGFTTALSAYQLSFPRGSGAREREVTAGRRTLLFARRGMPGLAWTSGAVMPDSPARTSLLARRPTFEWLVLPVALLASVWMAAGTWERVKTRPKDHSIRVTGSATKRIVSDLIQW